MIDAQTVRQIFLYHNDKDPNGIYADGVNILDFARKLEAYLNASRDSGQTLAGSPPAAPPR